MSLLLIGVRSPDYEANLRYAEALTQKLRALPPTVVNLATYDVRDLRAFFETEQVAVRLGGRPRIDPRSPAQRDQQAQEPALRVARRRGADRQDAEAPRAPRRPRRALPGRHLQQQQRRVRLDRRAAAGRAVRRARRRGAVQGGERADRERSPRALPPADAARGLGADRHRHRQPPGRRSTTSSGSPSPAWSS